MLLLTIIAVLLLIDVIVFANDWYGVSSILLAAEACALWFLFPEVKDVITGQGLQHFFLVVLPSYLGIGIAVATAKWIWFNIRVASQVKEYAARFVPDADSRDNPFTQFLQYIDMGEDRYSGIKCLLKHDPAGLNAANTKEEMIHKLTPQAKKAVDRIASWIWQWPIVCISFVVDDLILEIGKWVASVFGTIFTRFSKMLISRATANIGPNKGMPL